MKSFKIKKIIPTNLFCLPLSCYIAATYIEKNREKAREHKYYWLYWPQHHPSPHPRTRKAERAHNSRGIIKKKSSASTPVVSKY